MLTLYDGPPSAGCIPETWVGVVVPVKLRIKMSKSGSAVYRFSPHGANERVVLFAGTMRRVLDFALAGWTETPSRTEPALLPRLLLFRGRFRFCGWTPLQ